MQVYLIHLKVTDGSNPIQKLIKRNKLSAHIKQDRAQLVFRVIGDRAPGAIACPVPSSDKAFAFPRTIPEDSLNESQCRH